MLNKNNPHFEELRRLVHEYEERRAAHLAKKQDIINEFGWDSEELKAWYAEKTTMNFPLSGGQNKAYRAWFGSIADEQDEVEMRDTCWENERHDFIDTLRRAGIETLVVTDQSTGLMDDLHGYAAEGCTMLGLCTITRKEDRWGEETETPIQGIRFSLK